MKALMTPPAPDRELLSERIVRAMQIVGSPGSHQDIQLLRKKAAHAEIFSYYPERAARHFAAIIASGDRSAAVRGVKDSTLIIHFRADPMVHGKHGEATHRVIADAKLLVIDGMAHSLPTPALEHIATAISQNTRFRSHN